MNPLQYPEANGQIIRLLLDRYSEMPQADRRILEMGTKRWGDKPTHHRAIFDPYVEYVMTDVDAGDDVDYVCDAHALAEGFGLNRFSVILACSVWEHLKKPWIAARELGHVLTPGGIFMVQTHLLFPPHGYPNDYFRYTREGLESLFDWAIDVESAYDFPATLTPHDPTIPWNTAPDVEFFLNVSITGRKPV